LDCRGRWKRKKEAAAGRGQGRGSSGRGRWAKPAARSGKEAVLAWTTVRKAALDWERRAACLLP